MKILALGDTHFGYYYGRSAESRNSILNYFYERFESIIEIAKAEEIDYIIHTGDVFNRSKPPKKVKDRVYALFKQVLDNDIGLILIPGNHDRGSLPSTLFSFFYDKYHIINKLSKVKLPEVDIIGFPYEYKDPKGIYKKAIDLATRDPSIIISHQVFKNASFGPNAFTFRYGDDVIDSKLPDHIKFTLSGHIHRAQSLEDLRVYYTGSLIRTSFVESIEPKGYMKIEINEHTTKMQFRELRSAPMIVKERVINGSIEQLIDGIEINPDLRTLIRLVGRALSHHEIQYLYSKYTAKQFPLLNFSPRKPDIVLNNMYDDYPVFKNINFEQLVQSL